MKVGEIDVFVTVSAEISNEHLSKYADKELLQNCLKIIGEKTGAELLHQDKTFVKGSWISVSRTRSFLQKFFQTFKGALPSNNFDSVKCIDEIFKENNGDQVNSENDKILSVSKQIKQNFKPKVPDPLIYYDKFEEDGFEAVSENGIKSVEDTDNNIEKESNEIKTEDNDKSQMNIDDHIDDDLSVDFNVPDDNSDSDYLPLDEPVSRPLRSAKKVTKPKKNLSRKSKTIEPTKKKLKKSSENLTTKKTKVLRKTNTKVVRPKITKKPKISVADSKLELEYSCPDCPYVGKKKALLRQHKRRFHRTKDFPCDICGHIFGFNKDLTRHLKSHQKPQNCCDICGKMYKGVRSLAEHRKTHEENYEKPEFQCDVCDKSFSTKYVLSYHVKSEHLGLKRTYLCPTCGKSFSQKHSYLQHANVHLGIRNYKCDLCDKTFAYEKSLREHRFMHDNIRRFKCKQCEKSFRQSSALAIHARIHKVVKDYVCSSCGRGFSQKQALKRHERIHLGEKPFVCSLCSKHFTDSSVLRRHMILIHKKEPKKWREDTVSLVKKGHYFIDVVNKNSGQVEDIDNILEQTESSLSNLESQGQDFKLKSSIREKHQNFSDEKMFQEVNSPQSSMIPVSHQGHFHPEGSGNQGTVLSVPAIPGLSQNHVPHSYNPLTMYPNLDHNIYNLPSSSQYLQSQPINLHTLGNMPQPHTGYYPHEYPPSLPPTHHHNNV